MATTKKIDEEKEKMYKEVLSDIIKTDAGKAVLNEMINDQLKKQIKESEKNKQKNTIGIQEKTDEDIIEEHMQKLEANNMPLEYDRPIIMVNEAIKIDLYRFDPKYSVLRYFDKKKEEYTGAFGGRIPNVYARRMENQYTSVDMFFYCEKRHLPFFKKMMDI